MRKLLDWIAYKLGYQRKMKPLNWTDEEFEFINFRPIELIGTPLTTLDWPKSFFSITEGEYDVTSLPTRIESTSSEEIV